MTDTPAAPPTGTTCFEFGCFNKAKGYATPRDYGGRPSSVDAQGRTVHGAASSAASPPDEHPYCGVHLRMYASRKADAERREQHRQQEKRRRSEVARAQGEAANLAQFLTDQLGIDLVAIHEAHENRADVFMVAMTVETAQRIYSAGAWLTADGSLSVADTRWTAAP